MLRILLSVSNIVFSLILGTLLIAVVAVYFTRDTVDDARLGAQLKGLIASTGLDPKYDVSLELLLEERRLLLMFFTVVARMMLAILAYPIVLLRERT